MLSTMTNTALARARIGDEEAFRELTEPYRRELHVHCYRMLGSLTDAEDAVQETLLAAWRALERFEQRASVRSWLYRIATNRCLNARRDRRRRIPTEPIPPFEPPEPTARDEIPWLEPLPDSLVEAPDHHLQAVETIELAFIAALQRMAPRQTATLVLRDVLGFSSREVAAMLDTTETGVKGTLQRARAAARRSGMAVAAGTHGRPAAAVERDLSSRFAKAYVAGDVQGIVALLTDDAWLSMPPAPHRYRGREAIAGFLLASFTWRAGREVRLLPTRANGHPAFAAYYADGPGSPATPAGLWLVTVRRGGIVDLTRFLDPSLYARFELPTKLST